MRKEGRRYGPDRYTKEDFRGQRDEAVEWLHSVVFFSGVGLDSEPSIAQRGEQFERPKLEEFHQWTIAHEP